MGNQPWLHRLRPKPNGAPVFHASPARPKEGMRAGLEEQPSAETLMSLLQTNRKTLTRARKLGSPAA